MLHIPAVSSKFSSVHFYLSCCGTLIWFLHHRLKLFVYLLLVSISIFFMLGAVWFLIGHLIRGFEIALKKCLSLLF
jgi:hypothetical protein